MKLFKTLVIFFMVFGLFAVSGCTTQSFCTEQDKENITNKVIENLDDAFENGSSYTAGDGTTVKFDDWKNWYASSNNITGDDNIAAIDYEDWTSDSIEDKKAYVTSFYKFENSACLTLEEKVDGNGAVIEGKTFNDALELGLIEGLFVYPSSWLLITFGNLFGGDAYAQILSLFVVTFLIRGIVLSLTWKSTRSSQKMTALQDEMNKINAKYGDAQDQVTKNKKAQEMMDLYQKHGVNPMKSMLVPFITLPIFVAFYGAVRQTISIREGVAFGVELGLNLGDGVLGAFAGGSWFPVIVFVLMAGFQFVTMKLPQWLQKSKNKTPEYKKKQTQQSAAQMNSQMMVYMMLVMVIIAAWVLPIAMSIYWVASSAFSLLQTVLFKVLPSKEDEQQKKKVSFRS